MTKKHLYSLPAYMAGATAILAATSCSGDKNEQERFNIVYIMTDDHTAQMMSCYDNRKQNL